MKGSCLSANDSSPRFYLDTSAQVERLCGPDTTREAVLTLLTNGGHATSTQVRREWNSIMLGACARLLNALVEATDVRDLEARMNRGFGREPQQNWMATQLLVARDPDLRRAGMRARQYLRFGADAAFEQGVTAIRDGTDCDVARRNAIQDPKTGDWHHNNMCKKTENICSQPEFFAEHRDRAKAAATALEGSPRPADRKMGKEANKLLANTPSQASKGKACWGGGGIGGDICIALECGSQETLIATDQSFDLICPAIEVEHRRPT